MDGVHREVILAVGYSGFLLAVTGGIEWLARFTHRQAQAYRQRGFRYQAHLDAWRCPAGEHLHLREIDHARRLARYRAAAEACNACALKAVCTDSDQGREIVHATHDWLDTEIGRFHRGLSLALLGLGALILAVVWARHHQPRETMLILLASGVVAGCGSTFARQFRQSEAPAWRAGAGSSGPWVRR